MSAVFSSTTQAGAGRRPAVRAPLPRAPVWSRRAASSFGLRALLGEEPLFEAPALTLELERNGVVERREPRRLAQRRLHLPGELTRQVGGAVREASRLVEQRAGVDAPPRQADLGRPLAVERLAREHHRRRGLRPDGFGEQPRVPAARVQPDPGEAAVETGLRARDADVAGEREVHARADGGAVHRRHGWESAPIEAQEALVDRRQTLVPALLALRPAAQSLSLVVVASSGSCGVGRRSRRRRGQAADVGAGAERRRRAGHDERADALVVLEPVDGSDDLADEFRGQGVAAVGFVEREDRDAIALLDVEGQRRYPRSRTTAGECRKNVSTSGSYVYSGLVDPTARSWRSLRATAFTVPTVVHFYPNR